MKCKICDCDTKSFNDPQLNKHYYHCLNCDCIALDPTYFLSLEKENALYNNHQNSLENSGYVKMFEDFLDYFFNISKKAEFHMLIQKIYKLFQL